MNQTITAAILIIGNEILSGKTLDTNTQFIASNLSNLGIVLQEVRTIKDIQEHIVAQINELRAKYDYVFTTGGIGPTHDDITSQAIAAAFKVPLLLDEEAKAQLEYYYKSQHTVLTKPRLKMCMMPQGAKLICNKKTGAPGFYLENVFVLAGIPEVMQAMFYELKQYLPKGAEIITYSRELEASESQIAEDFAQLQSKFPNIEMGSYPFTREQKWHTTLVMRTSDQLKLNQAVAQLEDMLKKLNIN